MHKLFSVIALIFTLSATTVAAPSLVPAAPRIKASSYLLIDNSSGHVLASHNADKRIEPASMTKLLTAYVVLYEIQRGSISFEDEVKVSEKAWRMGGSRMFIEVNKLVPVSKLLKGLIVQSGNDATIALAEHVASNEQSFVELMNQHAERLGMLSSHFNNSTGWPDDNHFTTANDLAKLSRAVINDFPEHYSWYKEKEFTFNNIRQSNRNRLLWLDDRVDGLKTGHTEAAGYCLIASAVQNNMRLISIVAGTPSDRARISSSQKLLNYGFRFFETFQLHQAGTALTSMRIWKGEEENVSLGLSEDLFITAPRGLRNNIADKIQVEAMIEAPVKKGQPYGQVVITAKGQELARRPLVALAEVPEGGLWRKLVDNIYLMFQ